MHSVIDSLWNPPAFLTLCFKWIQVPTASITVEGNPALNRVRWTHSGREIAVGDSEGQIVIYDVGEVCIPCIVQSILQNTQVSLTFT